MINRPQPNEYPPYASGYVGLVGNDPILDILEHQKEITYNFLIRMGEAKGDFSYEHGKWTVKQVVGHMIDAERTFAFRAKLLNFLALTKICIWKRQLLTHVLWRI